MAAWGSFLTGLVGGAAAFCVAPSLHRVWKELRTLLIVLASLLLTVCFGGLRYATFHALSQNHPRIIHAHMHLEVLINPSLGVELKIRDRGRVISGWTGAVRGRIQGRIYDIVAF